MGFTRGILRGSIGLCDRYNNFGAVSYLINESFESGSEPTGWTHSGTVDYNYTAAPLDGYKSLSIAALLDKSYSPNVNPGSTLYTSFHFKLSALPSASSIIYRIYATDVVTTIGTLYTSNDGTLSVLASGGTTNYAVSSSLSSGVPIYIKLKYIQGTGANASLTVYTSANGTDWAQMASCTNGTSTAAPGAIAAIGLGTVAPVWDAVKVLASDITDARNGF